MVAPDEIVQLKSSSSKGFSCFKVKSSKSRDQEGFRAFPHNAEPVPLIKPNHLQKTIDPKLNQA